MAEWTAFPYAGDYNFDAASVKQHWSRLHVGDQEACPKEARLLEAWALFHNGAFQKATEAGLKLGAAGLSLANKATCIYANYLETREKTRLELFLGVAERCAVRLKSQSDDVNAWYWQAYAIGRYGQGISVARALAQGLGSKVKDSLEKVIALQPAHADAHIALGSFHAEVIDKVGSLIGSMTYGAKRDVGLKLFQQALKLNPGSAIGMIEYANALVMLDGDKKMKEATALYEKAAACTPINAMERLDVELARTELADE